MPKPTRLLCTRQAGRDGPPFVIPDLPADEAMELLESTGQTEPGLNQLIRVGFGTLGLQTYLTAGPKEARAWVIPVGATAP